MAASQGEKYPNKLKSESEPIEEESSFSSPSIYGVVAAHSLSRDIKQKSLHLIKVKRRHGDWGQFDLTHAWSPEELSSNMGSRHSSGLVRDTSSLVDDNLTLARPFVMEPLRTFQEYRVRPIIQHVLETNLAEQKYDPVFCKDATVRITEEIKERVKKLGYPRYKLICHVIIGDVNRQDVKVVSRCAWDAAVDRYAQFEYRNYYLYAVGIVYGIYCE